MSDTEPGPAEPRPAAVVLREPAHLVCPRAVTYWRFTAAIGAVVVLLALAVPVAGLLSRGLWWAAVLIGVLYVAMVALRVGWMPRLRYRIHRWETTDEAVFTRAGWLGTDVRIVPLNRVQTVDSHQSALMRLFKIATVRVTTASSAGAVVIEGLDAADAQRVVAELTTHTAASAGDAT